jgi:triphosphatase
LSLQRIDWRFAMTEFELKLELPSDRYEELAAALAVLGEPRPQRLQARYFDTEKAELSRCGVVVRVRKEGPQWMQTAKAGTGASLERLEHNVTLSEPGSADSVAVDLSRHMGTPLEEKIRKALGLRQADSFPPLVMVFETDVERLVQEVKVGNSTVEIALDRGRVAAGVQHETLCELEFELKSGAPEDAVGLARTWCARHGLWISAISKSQKGQRLAGQNQSATGFKPPQFSKHVSGPEFVAAVIQACLNQVLPNASEIAAGSTDSEHIHQLRVGIRRLRSALRELKTLSPGIDSDWDGHLTKVFRVLGEHRDQNFCIATLQPQLEAAGGPPVLMDTNTLQSAPGPAVRSPAFQDVLFELLAFAHRTDSDSLTAIEAKPLVLSRLGKLHRKLLKDGKHFLSLDVARQHRVRKQLKRLRYLAELCAPLFSVSRLERFLDRVKPAQQSLGLYNDELMALETYVKLSKADSRAFFGVGWLSARRAANAAACAGDLDALARRKVFWKH